MLLPKKRTREFTIKFSNWKDASGVKLPFDPDEERREGIINQSFATSRLPRERPSLTASS